MGAARYRSRVDAATLDPDYAPYADGPSGPFRWRLGLRPLESGDWIELGATYDRDLARKREVLDQFPDTVAVALPAARSACAEVLDHVVDHLVTQWPTHFRHDGGAVVNVLTGERWDLDGAVHPLEIAGRLVQEDLIVMIEAPDGEHAGELVFAAGVVCFPNRWDLRSKLGLPSRSCTPRWPS